MAVWSGIYNGIPTADMSPAELAPTTQQQLHWPKWGKFYETGGQSGEESDLEHVVRLARLNDQWVAAKSSQEREQIWHEMLSIHADQVFTLGVIAGVPQPVVFKETLKNLPEEGLYNWDPGAFFGIYHLDSLWFETNDEAK